MLKNSHATSPSSLQWRFSISVWAGNTDGYLIRSEVLEDCFDLKHYVRFLEKLPPYLLDDVHFFTCEWDMQF
jgi:hypothetical protein